MSILCIPSIHVESFQSHSKPVICKHEGRSHKKGHSKSFLVHSWHYWGDVDIHLFDFGTCDYVGGP